MKSGICSNLPLHVKFYCSIQSDFPRAFYKGLLQGTGNVDWVRQPRGQDPWPRSDKALLLVPLCCDPARSAEI